MAYSRFVYLSLFFLLFLSLLTREAASVVPAKLKRQHFGRRLGLTGAELEYYYRKRSLEAGYDDRVVPGGPDPHHHYSVPPMSVTRDPLL